MLRKLGSFIIAATLITTMVVPASGDELSDAKGQKSSIDNKLNSIEQQKIDEQKKLKSVQQEKNSLASSQAKAETEYKLTASDVKEIQQEIKSIETAYEDAEKSYNKQKELFKNRIRIMYQNSNTSYLNALSQSGSLNDFFSKLQIFSTIAKRDKELVVTLESSKQDVEYKRKLKEDEKRQQEMMLDNKKRTLSSIQLSRSKKEEEEKKINSALSRLEQQENDLLKKSEQLSKMISNLNNRRKGGYVNGQMVWPTPGYNTVTSYYGNRLHPVLKTYRMHTGVDIGAPYGAAIVSANKGTVVLAGWQDGYGNTVVVDHGGDVVTLYAHCSSLLVKTGQEVNAGATIAKVGSTGLSTGPHLHFEVRKGGSTVNPLNYFGR